MEDKTELKAKQIYDEAAPVLLDLFKRFVYDIVKLPEAEVLFESPTTVLEKAFSDYSGEHFKEVRQALSKALSSVDESELIALKKENTQKKE